MAQFDVYRRPGNTDLLLDCQSDLLAELPTRFLVPLVRQTGQPVSSRLNPAFEIDGHTYTLATQLALSAPLDRVGSKIGSMASSHDEIVRAVDILIGGV